MEPLNELIGDAEDLGEADEMAVIDRLVPVSGLKVADVGCGGGRITRQLAERGANTLGVEPDPIQAEKNRTADAVPGLTFVEAPGQALPVDDASLDGVFFSYSLHHVPREHMDAALAEAVRVLKPETGFLYAMEPMLGGDMEAVYRSFHDESGERALAYDALKRVAEPRFAEARELRYREPVPYDSFETFVDEVSGTTYEDFPREIVDTPDVKARFEVGRAEDGYVFTQHIRINLYRGPLA
ncbi:MAG: class I SAM-dependent methyltransferase [Pseudomonadota bacterium]